MRKSTEYIEYDSTSTADQIDNTEGTSGRQAGRITFASLKERKGWMDGGDDTMEEHNGWGRSAPLRWRYNQELVGTVQETVGSTVHLGSLVFRRCIYIMHSKCQAGTE